MLAVELVSTGTELLNGSHINTHARQLAESLKPLGFDLQRDVTVRDDVEAISDAVRQALHRVRVVFVSGGLGPTSDDITRDAVASVLSRSVVLDERWAKVIQRRTERAGRSFTESARRQALVVDGAETLSNPVGVAPGERIDVDGGKVLFLLPGPPGELLAIVDKHVLPWLKENVDIHTIRHEAILMLTRMGESDLATKFDKASFPPPGIDVGYCSRPGELEVRLSSATDDLSEAVRFVSGLAGDSVYALSRMGLDACVADAMSRFIHTFAVVETATGGELMRALSSQPQARQKLVGGWVILDHETLIRELAVDRMVIATHGVASDVVVRRMAEAVRIRLKASIGVAIGGPILCPGLNDERRDGAAWVAVHDGTTVVSVCCSLPRDAESRRVFVAKVALNQIRLFLQNMSPR